MEFLIFLVSTYLLIEIIKKITKNPIGFALLLYTIFTYVVYELSTIISMFFFNEFYNLSDEIYLVRLILGLIWILSTYIILNLNKQLDSFIFNTKQIKGWQIYNIIAYVILFCYVLAGGINARESFGNEIELGGAFHFVRGIFDFLYICIFVVLISNRFHGYTLLLITLLLVILGGHRGLFLSFIVVYLLYLISNNKLQLKLKGLILFCITLLVLLNVTFKRFDSDVDKGFILIDRLYEPTIDRVIDYSLYYDKLFWFENFDRVFTMPIPSFIFKNKPNNDDKDDVLSKYYGLHISSKSHWPLPFLADGYRRFGLFGALLISVLLVLILIKTSKFLSKANYFPIYAFVCAFSYRMFSFSVLGTISFWLYSLIKIILFYSIVELFIYLIKNENTYSRKSIR